MEQRCMVPRVPADAARESGEGSRREHGSSIESLPDEVWTHVILKAGATQLTKMATTSRWWRDKAANDHIWKELCTKDNIQESIRWQLFPDWKNLILKRSHKYSGYYKQIHARGTKQLRNIRELDAICSEVPVGPDRIKCLKTTEQHVIVGSKNGTVTIWSMPGPCLLSKLFGHTKSVKCIEADESIVVSGSSDGTIRIWHIESSTCKHILEEDMVKVTVLKLWKDHLISISNYDETITKWNVRTGEREAVLRGHNDFIMCIDFNGDIIVAGSYDSTVHVWDSRLHVLMKSFKDHEGTVKFVQISGSYFVSHGDDDIARLRHTGNLDTVAILPHQGSGFLHLTKDFLLTRHPEGAIHLYDINQKRCFYIHDLQGDTYSMHVVNRCILWITYGGEVKCLALNKHNAVVSVSEHFCSLIPDLRHTEFNRSKLVFTTEMKDGRTYALYLMNFDDWVERGTRA